MFRHRLGPFSDRYREFIGLISVVTAIVIVIDQKGQLSTPIDAAGRMRLTDDMRIPLHCFFFSFAFFFFFFFFGYI